MSDGILSRWSRRKQAVRAAERVPPAEAPDTQDASSPVLAPAPVPAPAEARAEADALAEAIARLPKLKDLTAQTDLAPFLRAGIPTALRNAALRRMWSVDPAIRDFVSEAREYAYDWNVPGGVPGLGPMLPTDDIAAMVERIMTGPAPAPAAPEPASDAPEPEGDPAPEPEAEAERDAVIALPEPAAHVDGPVLDPMTKPSDAFQSPAIVSRLRRHGGALPG